MNDIVGRASQLLLGELSKIISIRVTRKCIKDIGDPLSTALVLLNHVIDVFFNLGLRNFSFKGLLWSGKLSSDDTFELLEVDNGNSGGS